MNQSIHSIDLLQWFMGPVRSVHAYTGTLAHQIETEDTAVAAIRFANGALGSIAATTSAYPGVSTRLEIVGSEGSAIIEDDRLRYLQLKREGEATVGPYGPDHSKQTQPGSQQPEGDAHIRQMEDIIRAIRADETPVVDGTKARHGVEIILDGSLTGLHRCPEVVDVHRLSVSMLALKALPGRSRGERGRAGRRSDPADPRPRIPPTSCHPPLDALPASVAGSWPRVVAA